MQSAASGHDMPIVSDEAMGREDIGYVEDDVGGIWRVLAAVLALITAACGSSNPLGGGEISGDLKSIVVGSADFPESKIIAEIYAQALEANGFTVGRQFGIGSRETYIPAVQGPFDRSGPGVHRQPAAVLRPGDHGHHARTPSMLELLKRLPGDLSILTPSPAADTDTRRRHRRRPPAKWNLKTIADLASTFGGGEVRRAVGVSDPRRPGCSGSKEKYGLDIAPGNFVAISDGGGPATVERC